MRNLLPEKRKRIEPRKMKRRMKRGRGRGRGRRGDMSI
jgi:hypothetical protein